MIKILITLIMLTTGTSVLASPTNKPFDPRRYEIMHDYLYYKVCTHSFNKGDISSIEHCQSGVDICIKPYREAIESNPNYDAPTVLWNLTSCVDTMIRVLGGTPKDV